ncbi:hypothetical protein DK389_22135 [Methylobacterium durans]|uniref:Uncharacterized protein n=1 Tax=Methylobacterium durans TaxID=2202825 RepID=A0A2U8W9P2_9HYPH|nr:hypothetical protein DK389_22135 [Methylobacterium durans]
MLVREFAHAAADIEAHRSATSVHAIRAIARYHRIKALEHRGRLAALGEEFGWLLSGPLAPIHKRADANQMAP